MLFAQAKVMFEVVPLIFQGVEHLVFDSPTGPTGTHNLVHVVDGEGKIGNPTESGFFPLAVELPVLKDIDQKTPIGFIERDPIDEAEGMGDPRLALDGLGKFSRFTVLGGPRNR